MNLSNCLDDLVHVGTGSQQHRLVHPHGLFAEPGITIAQARKASPGIEALWDDSVAVPGGPPPGVTGGPPPGVPAGAPPA